MVIKAEHNERRSHLVCSHNFSNVLLMIHHVDACWAWSVVWTDLDDLAA
jgi:hypothetical protein